MARNNTAEIELALKDLVTKEYKRVEKTIGRSNKAIVKSLKDVERQTKQIDQKVLKTFGGFKKILKESASEMASFAKRFGPAAIAIGVFTFAMVKAGEAIDFVRQKTIEFEKTISRLKAIIGPRGTQADFDALSEKAKELGESTAFSASQAGNAFTELAKLGLTTNQILGTSQAVLSLAAAAESDMATAAATTAETLAQFSLTAAESTRVTDVMAKSFNISALDINRFSESMKFAGLTAGALGTTVETTTAALATLSKSAITGSMAGTALRRIMLELGDANGKAAKLINRADFATLSFTEKLEILQSKNLSPSKIKDTFGLLSTTAALVLINGAKNVEEFDLALQNAEGTAKTMADTMRDNVAGATIILESAQEGLGIAIGESFGRSKQERIESYTVLIQRATEFVKAHKQEIALFGKALDLTIRFMVRVGVNFAKVILGGFNILVGSIDFIVGAAIDALGEISSAFNAIAGFLGFDDAIINVEEIDRKAGLFFENMQKQGKSLKGLIFGTEFAEEAKKNIRDVGEAIKTAGIAPEFAADAPEEDSAARRKRLAAEKEAKRAKDAAFKLQGELEILTRSGRDRELAELSQFEAEKRAILLAANETNFDTLEAVVAERREAINEKFLQMEKDKNDAALKLAVDLKEARDRLREQEVASQQAATLAIVSNTAKAFEGMREFAKLQRVLALSEAIIQGALGTNKALGAAPPPFNFVLAASVAAAAAANVATIASQKLAVGGVVTGGQKSGDTNLVGLNAGEVVFTNNQFKSLLRMTESGGGSQASFGDININISGNADGRAVGEMAARTIQEKLRIVAKDNRRTRALQVRNV